VLRCALSTRYVGIHGLLAPGKSARSAIDAGHVTEVDDLVLVIDIGELCPHRTRFVGNQDTAATRINAARPSTTDELR
jgi:hypothetical protein